MSKFAEVTLRIVIALVMGLAVMVIALNTARDLARDMYMSPQDVVPSGFRLIDEAIDRYRQQRHALPRSLSQPELNLLGWPALDDQPATISPIRVRQDKVLLDPWMHPYVYTVSGNKYVVTSYGRDGKPGGVGYDCDRTNLNPNPPEATPTFPQLFADPLARPMVLAGTISGGLVFLFTLLIVRPQNFSRQQIFWLLGKLALTFLSALFIAMLMLAAEVPSGH